MQNGDPSVSTPILTLLSENSMRRPPFMRCEIFEILASKMAKRRAST